MRLYSSMSLALTLLLCGGGLGALSQTPATTPAAQQQTPADGSVDKTAPVEERPDPLKRRLSDTQERNRRKALTH